jgi:hypothetical protein
VAVSYRSEPAGGCLVALRGDQLSEVAAGEALPAQTIDPPRSVPSMSLAGTDAGRAILGGPSATALPRGRRNVKTECRRSMEMESADESFI